LKENERQKRIKKKERQVKRWSRLIGIAREKASLGCSGHVQTQTY